MSFTWFKPALLAFGLLLASARLVPAALSPGEAEPRAASLVGQFLVAAPGIPDPRFRHTVILIVLHDEHGALGIIVNRPIGERPMADLLDAVGEDTAGVAGNVPIFIGGPVDPQRGFILHSAEYHRAGTIAIDGHVAMTFNAEVLVDIGRHQGPAKSLIAFGYTGWGAGQLESELTRGGWFVEPEDPGLVFDEERGKVWDEAMAKSK